MSRRSARHNAQSQPTINALALNALADALISRADLSTRMGQSFAGARDYWEVFGYQRQVWYLDYLAWYKRGGIAKPIIDLPREKCWSSAPVVQEDANQFSDTEFELGYKALSDRLNLPQLFKRADTLAGLGRYCAILIGVKSPFKLDTPLTPGQLKSPDDIVYLSPYSEANARIIRWETEDTSSPYYAKPLIYQINIGAPLLHDATAAVPGPIYNIPVHASRIVHIANGCLEDEYFGTPDLEAVYNHLYDLLKVAGGGAEIYWLNARNGLKIKTDQGATMDIEGPDGQKLLEAVRKYNHQLTRELFLNGADAQVLLNNQPIDPRGASDTIMHQIAAISRIPKRILIGSEQGEQASTQDRINFAEQMMGRQVNVCAPNIVLKFVKQLITLGALAQPKAGPFVIWEPLLKMDESQRASVALNQSQSIQEYLAHPEAIDLVSPGEFRQSLGLDAEMSPEMRKMAEDYRKVRDANLPDTTPQPPDRRGMPGEPAVNVMVPEVAPAITKDELFALENRLTTALRSMSSETPRPFINFDKSREIREQLTALTQQVQTALLKNASETQLTALAQRVEACLQQLSSLQPQAPPVVNINIPEGAVRVSVPAPQVTIQQPKKTKEVIERDEHREITSIVREVIE